MIQQQSRTTTIKHPNYKKLKMLPLNKVVNEEITSYNLEIKFVEIVMICNPLPSPSQVILTTEWVLLFVERCSNKSGIVTSPMTTFVQEQKLKDFVFLGF